MDRRTYLASVTGGLAGLAGCATGPPADRATTGNDPSADPRDTRIDDGSRNRTDDSRNPTGDGNRNGTGERNRNETGGAPDRADESDSGASDSTERPPSPAEVDLPVPRRKLLRGAPKDGIAAIVDPAFGEDWSGVSLPGQESGGTLRLRPADLVIGVAREDGARAYPLRVLRVHEVVNDAFGGPVLVTFCPLCGSAVTAVRRVDGEPTLFGVSGLLWRSDLVMYDRATDSLWSQILATAIRGPATGDRLALLPSTVTTWRAWRGSHPDTRVLRPPPESSTIASVGAGFYGASPYEPYRKSDRVGRSDGAATSGAPHSQTLVIGVTHGGEARAYPLPAVERVGVVNDAVGGLPVVVAAGPDHSLVAYVRSVDGEELTFETGRSGTLRAGGSRWNLLTGEAISGPHEGTTLRRANDRSPMFWFAWREFNPGITVSERG